MESMKMETCHTSEHCREVHWPSIGRLLHLAGRGRAWAGCGPAQSSPRWLAVWLSGNALASINVVALRQTRLVLGWVTVYGRVNHLGM